MNEMVMYSAILFLALVAGAYLVIYQLPRHWDGRLREKEQMAWEFFPYSDEFKSGMKRIVPISMLGVLFLLFGGMAGVVAALTQSKEPTGLFLVLAILSAIPLVLFLPLAYLVVYRNRPKFLVAPHYRDEKGVVQVRREQGRLGRSRVRTFVEVVIWLAVAAGIAALIVLFNPRP